MDKKKPEYFSISDKAFDFEVPYRENLQRIGEAGFTHIHLSHGWTRSEALTEEACQRLEEDLHATGIQVLDVHGCHPKNTNTWSSAKEARENAIRLLRHRLQVTKRLGGDAMVYHVPWNVEMSAHIVDLFIEGLKQVEEDARELGLSIALENHYRGESDRQALEAAFATFDESYIGFTFDPGHALISGNTEWILSHCAPRLQILHLNDNDTRKDLHWNPYEEAGQADWSAIEDFVRKSHYRKPIQLEVQWRQDLHPTHEAFLRSARASAGRFASAVRGL
ncbi:MAG: sugar phosphate isomerase/epimerase [Opitutales bacterium]|nr:sugar phosphate isomerase/epimerase [Opitutales bacterium]MCH8540657.1 sugar phosphate isomerase/epimerase [Opitutales bacterium]